ncbi:MAG: sugar phosphate isomerase/epimerase [Planctomycetota bacterium]|nr:sugar phosphate isomerase/epimerase [Planctomycetota bacterium]
MLSACREVGEYAAKKGVTFAIETGPEKSEILRDFLEELSCPGMGVNLDPANLVMVAGDEAARAVRNLGKYIVHTHAKDGIMVQPHDPREVYGLLPEDPPQLFPKRQGELYREVPLGEGKVDWQAYLQALSEVGFKGYLTIEREVGADPAADIRKAVQFLRARI